MRTAFLKLLCYSITACYTADVSEKQTSVGKKDIFSRKVGIIPPIDDYPSREKWEEAAWRKILESGEMLSSLITSHERHNLVMRAAALEGLVSGKGPRQLSRELLLSTQTINAVKKAMTENNYKSYLERSKKERRKREYSYNHTPRKKKHKGRPIRTKYGTLHIPDHL